MKALQKKLNGKCISYHRDRKHTKKGGGGEGLIAAN